jgi:hypothetical protein
MEYRATAKQPVVFVTVQRLIAGQQMRVDIGVGKGRLLPDGVAAAVIETLLGNGLIEVDTTADDYERLFRYDPAAAAADDNAYSKLFVQPYEPKTDPDPEGYSDYAKLLPPAGDSTPPDHDSLPDDLAEAIEPLAWRLMWRRWNRPRRKAA